MLYGALMTSFRTRSGGRGSGRRLPTAPLGRLSAAMLGISLAIAACGQVSPSGSPPAATPAGASPAATVWPAASASPTASASALAAPRPIATAAASPIEVRVRVARSDIRLPSARSRAVALVLGSTILVCGGLMSDGTTSGSITRIDLRSSYVSRVGALAAPVHDAGGAVLGGSGFVFGGGRSVAVSVVQRIDPTGRAITVGHLPAVRADLSAVAADGELFIVGGGTPSGPDDQVLATTDGHDFRTVAKLLVGVRYPAIAVVGGLVYVIGGSTASGDTRAIQAVDPQTGAVRIVGRLAHGLSHASALVVGGALLLAGGRAAGRVQDGLWQIDVANGTVTPIGRLPYAVSDAAVAVSDGTGYLIGGERLHPLATIIAVTAR